jgi:LuxR family maltose regulon positive regulatory protein
MVEVSSIGDGRRGMSAGTSGKVGRPRLRGVVVRERLLAALEHLHNRPVVWVTGPAGAGKTTLLASYLEARGRGGLWYPIDGRDQDLASFFYFLGQAANAGRRGTSPLPLLTPEYLLGLPTFTRRFFRSLFGRLPAGSALVLDNYQEVPAEGPFQEMMRVALEEVPPGCRVMVASRHRPPAAFARLQANGLLTVLGWPELRLTEAEAQAIVRRRAGTAVPAAAVNTWFARTGGWVAGLVLWLEAAKTAAALPAASEAPEVLFDYFASELLAKLEAATRDFLLITALLPQIRPALAATLTANPQAEQVLGALVRRNVFTTRHLGRETRYQYHPLFRAYLLAEGPKRFGEARYRALKRRAADLLEAAGEVEPSIEYRLALGDWGPLTVRVAEAAPALLAQGRNQTLLGWLDSVPEPVHANHPWLGYWRGLALLPLDPRAARPILQAAYHGFKQAADPNGLYLTWSSVAYSYCVERYFAPLAQWLDEFQSLRRHHPVVTKREVEIETATRVYCTMVACRPEETTLPQWEQTLIGLLEEDLPFDSRLLTASHLVWRNSLHGGSREVAARALISVQSWIGTSSVSPLSEILALFLKAAYDYWYTSRPEVCFGAVDAGLAKAHTHGVHVWNALLLMLRGWAHLSEEQHAAAKAATDELESSSMPGCHHDKSICAYHRAWHAWLCDDLEQAKEHAMVAFAEWIESGMRVAYMFPPVALAQIAASEGVYKEALCYLGNARRVARETHYQNVEFMCLLADAQIALERGQPERSRGFLRRALAIGRRQGYVRVPFFKREDFARLYQLALASGIETDYAARVLHERGLVDPALVTAGESWNWALRVYTLGRFELTIDGEPVRFPRKAPKRALELLQALIAFGGQAVPTRRLITAVWGRDVKQGSSQAVFRTTLHRLRKLVGEALITVDDGRVRLDAQRCWVDAWAFEALLDKLQATKRAPDPDTWLAQAERALALYRGSFLGAEAEASWSFSARDRLHQRFVGVLDAMGRHWQAGGDWEKALALYERGLAVDEHAETFYQGLMRSYQALGRRAEAIAVYQRCQRLVETTFGRSPCPATEELYRSIRAG